MYPWRQDRGKEGWKPREIQETLLAVVTLAFFSKKSLWEKYDGEPFPLLYVLSSPLSDSMHSHSEASCVKRVCAMSSQVDLKETFKVPATSPAMCHEEWYKDLWYYTMRATEPQRDVQIWKCHCRQERKKPPAWTNNQGYGERMASPWMPAQTHDNWGGGDVLPHPCLPLHALQRHKSGLTNFIFYLFPGITFGYWKITLRTEKP